ncbi:MAG: hypothetical protein IKL76_04265 [Clostridia bacterium]|nr:hypothetical protein [Clostridia bacterium]
MDKTKNLSGEDNSLQTLVTLEDLAEKKTKIYSRLLMDVALAKEMETLSMRHQKRRQALEKLLYGEPKTKKGDKEE